MTVKLNPETLKSIRRMAAWLKNSKVLGKPVIYADAKTIALYRYTRTWLAGKPVGAS